MVFVSFLLVQYDLCSDLDSRKKKVARPPRFTVLMRLGTFNQTAQPPPPVRQKNFPHLSRIKVITQNHQTILTRFGAFSAQATDIFSVVSRLSPGLLVLYGF